MIDYSRGLNFIALGQDIGIAFENASVDQVELHLSSLDDFMYQSSLLFKSIWPNAFNIENVDIE